MEVFLQLALNYMDLRKIKGIQTTNFAFTFKARDIEALPVFMASFEYSLGYRRFTAVWLTGI